MPTPKVITDPTTTMNMTLILMAKAFKLNYSTPTNNNQRISLNPCNREIVQPGMNMGQDRHIQMVGGNGGNQFRQYAGQNEGKQNGYNAVQNVKNQVVQNAVQNPGVQNVRNQNGLYFRPRRRDAVYLQTQLLIAQKEEVGIQLQAEEFDLMAAAADLDEIEEVNANCILMANLQQASTSGTQTDKAPVTSMTQTTTEYTTMEHLHVIMRNLIIYTTQESSKLRANRAHPEHNQVQQNDSNVNFMSFYLWNKMGNSKINILQL
ncbi:hypothetical protein Tco_0613862 [Tanacetum coccineum]